MSFVLKIWWTPCEPDVADLKDRVGCELLLEVNVALDDVTARRVLRRVDDS